MELDCKTVKTKVDAGDDFVFLDCREQSEYDTVRIEGTTLLPMSEIQERVQELNDFKSREIIIHCHHGGRSLQVASWLRSLGFEKTLSMSGGIDAWAIEIDPTLSRY